MRLVIVRTRVGDFMLNHVIGNQYIGHDDNVIRDGSYDDLEKVKLIQVMMVGGFAFILDNRDDIQNYDMLIRSFGSDRGYFG